MVGDVMSKGLLTNSLDADGQLVERSGNLMLVHITSGETAGTVTIYDGTDTDGTAIFTATGVASATADFPIPNPGVHYETGLYGDLDANVTEVRAYWDE